MKHVHLENVVPQYARQDMLYLQHLIGFWLYDLTAF